MKAWRHLLDKDGAFGVGNHRRTEHFSSWEIQPWPSHGGFNMFNVTIRPTIWLFVTVRHGKIHHAINR